MTTGNNMFIDFAHKNKFHEMVARLRQYKRGKSKWRTAMRRKRATISRRRRRR